jgi:hypothetical protein
MRARAGRHAWGYVEPTEAAWELLNEAAEPFLAEMKRLVDLGLAAEALSCCRGVVRALHRVCRDPGDQVLGMAPDFPRETAAYTVAELVRLVPSGRRRRWDLSATLADDAPEWTEMLARVTRTPPTGARTSRSRGGVRQRCGKDAANNREKP